MYAIFKSGGKQYKAERGAMVRLEKLPGEVGDTVRLDQVLMVKDGEETRIGRPCLDDTRVRGRIVEQGRGKKIIVFKSKRRKDYRKKMGHRQEFTGVLIEDIETGSGEVRIEKTTEGTPEAVEVSEAPETSGE